MANNTKIPFVQLSDTVNTHRKRFNQLVDSVGDITSLTTDAVDVVQSINELDAKLDSIQNTGLWTPGAHFSDSNFVSHFDGQLNVDTRIWTSNLEADSAYVGQLNASQVDIDSAYVDVLDVHFLHADSAYIDGDLSVKGNLTVDGIATLKAGASNNISLGDDNTDNVIFNADVNSNILPNATGFNIGSQTQKWDTVWAENASIDSAYIEQLNSVNADIDSAYVDQLNVSQFDADSAYVDQLNVSQFDADSGHIDQFNARQVAIDSAIVDQLNVLTADIDQAQLDSAYATNFSAGQVLIDSAHIYQLNVNDAAIDSAAITNLHVSQFSADSAFIKQLNFLDVDIDSAFMDQLNVKTADIDTATLGQVSIDSAYTSQLNVITGDIDTLTSTNATLDSAFIGQLNANDADIDSAHISQLHVDSADFGTLSTSGFIGVIDSAAASVMHINNLSVNTLNAETQVVQGNVRVGDAYVVLLSENTPDQGQPTQNAGISVRRRAYDSAVIEWDETGNYWVANYDSSNTSQILTASNIDGTTLEFTSGTVNVKNNGIALGTKTTGNYVQSVGVTASTGLSATGTGEGAAVTLAGVNATTSVKGVASFSSDNFSVSNGAVSIKNNGITLGTETTGNYMTNVSGTTNEISVTHTQSEGSTATIGLPDDVTITKSLSTKFIDADSADISQFAADSANISGALWVGGNTILKGNLTVSGTTTTVNTETINLADNIINLNSNHAGAPTQDAGLRVERGNQTDVQLVWDESSKYWMVGEGNAPVNSRLVTAKFLDATAPISYDSNFGSFTHDNSGVTANTYGQSGAEDGQYIKSITVNATGHITGITADDFDNRYDNYGSWTAKDGDTTQYTITSGDTLTFAEGTDLDVNFTADDVLTFKHKNVTRANVSASETVAHSGTFDVVDSIQTSATGHVTQVATRAITLPAGSTPNNATITIDPGLGLKTGGNFTTDQASDETITLNLDSAQLRDYYLEPLVPGSTFSHIKLSGETETGDLRGNIQSDNGIFGFSHTNQFSIVPIELKIIQGDTTLNDNQDLGAITFSGENSAGQNFGHTDYAQIHAQATDVTDGTEDGRMVLRSARGGSLRDNIYLASGVVTISSATAGFFKAPLDDGYAVNGGWAGGTQDSEKGATFFFERDTVGSISGPVNLRIHNNMTSLSPGGTSAIVDGTLIGHLDFVAENSGKSNLDYARIRGYAHDVTSGTEDGRLEMFVQSGGTRKEVFKATGTSSTIISAPFDIYMKPNGNDVYMQGSGGTSAEIQFNLGSSGQTITTSDALTFRNDANTYLFKAETENLSSRPIDMRIVNTDTSPDDGDYIGSITFRADNFGGTEKVYSRIEATIDDVSTGTEDGDFSIYNMVNGTETRVFRAESSTTTVSGGFISLVSNGSIWTDANGTGYYQFSAENQPSSTVGGYRHFMTNNPSSNTSNGDISHELIFNGYNGSGNSSDWARIKVGIVDATNGSEDGKLEIFTEKAGSNALCATFEDTNLTVQGDVNSLSDVRTKENIETVENGLDLVSQLRGVWYNKINNEDRKVGVIAQEVEEVLPEVVNTDTEGMKSVDYGKMVGVLIEAVKEQQAMIEEMKQEIEQLKSN